MTGSTLDKLPLAVELETIKVLKALPAAHAALAELSQHLLNNLFKHPYTKIEFLVNDLGVSRLTAANYLNKLAEDKMLRKNKLGTGNYYINEDLFELLTKR